MTEDPVDQENWSSEFGPESPLHWDFDCVPDAELIACCLWEYARESKTIAMKADLYWCRVRHISHRKHFEHDPTIKKEHDKEVARIEERASREGFDYDSFSEKFWKTDYPLLAIYESITQMVGDWARPWQHLSREARTGLSN